MCSTTTTCCFNLSSSAPFSSISPTKFSVIPMKLNDSRTWSGQSAIAASLVYAAIGIGVSSLLFSESVDAAVVMEDDVILEVAARRQRGAMRWSDKRACPPWRSKSFEQVVPENLPRASRRSKIESIGSRAHYFWDAPGVAGVGDREKGINGDCFSL